MPSPIDYGVYLVTDRAILGERDLLSSVEAALLGGVTCLQLREKEISGQDFYHLALALKELADRYQVPLIINDRIDIALAVDAAGVHVGQEDIPAPQVRSLIGPHKLLGVSAATLAEARLAQSQGADYIGVGAMFPTPTKTDTRPVTLAALAEIKAAVSIPVVAIGGIQLQHLPQLKSTGIDGVAVVSAILGTASIQEAARSFRTRWQKEEDNVFFK